MSTWEERMSQRHAERQRAREQVRHDHLDREYPRVHPRESEPWDCASHQGHRTHIDAWHGNTVMCSCGASMGIFSIVVEAFVPSPQPCPICVARGILDVEAAMARLREECPEDFSPVPPAVEIHDGEPLCRRCFSWVPNAEDDPRWTRYYWSQACDPETCGCAHHGSGVWYDDVPTAV